MARVEFRERGRRTLRNVPQPVILYAAVREGARTAEDLAIDPVCRMAVDPEKSAGRLVFADTELYFCSIECVQKFVAAPERYVAA